MLVPVPLAPSLICPGPGAAAPSRLIAQLPCQFLTGFHQWEALELDWRAGRREKPEYFSSLCFGLCFWQWPPFLWGCSSSRIGRGCGSSFPRAPLIPKLATSSFGGAFLPLTIAGEVRVCFTWPCLAFQLFHHLYHLFPYLNS